MNLAGDGLNLGPQSNETRSQLADKQDNSPSVHQEGDMLNININTNALASKDGRERTAGDYADGTDGGQSHHKLQLSHLSDYDNQRITHMLKNIDKSILELNKNNPQGKQVLERMSIPANVAAHSRRQSR